MLFGIGAASAQRRPLPRRQAADALAGGTYSFATGPAEPVLATLAWLLGGYVFTRWLESRKPVRLVAPDGVDAAEIAAIAEAVATGRDLVNMPANDLGPDGLEARRRLADRHGAAVEVIVGDDLLTEISR